MNITPVHTAVFKEREDLAAFIMRHIPSVPEETVLTVSFKLVVFCNVLTAAYKSREQK